MHENCVVEECGMHRIKWIKSKLDRWLTRHPVMMILVQIVLSAIFVWLFCFLFFSTTRG